VHADRLHVLVCPTAGSNVVLATWRLSTAAPRVQALQLASKVDPSHARTIGVLTKIDLMDRGTNAVDILSNRKYPLKLGWVGVVNRSQQDIEGRKTLHDAKEAEKQYFHGPTSPYRHAPRPAAAAVAEHRAFVS
jgi:Dynamin central region